MSAAHAQVQGRRPHRDRAVASLKHAGDSRPDRGPLCSGPHHRGRWLHQRRHRRHPGRQPDPNPQIGCAACIAACPNSAGQLFTAAKLAHLNLLPQGQPERYQRTIAMVEKMEEFFGSCTNHGECEEACPKSISIDNIALMNRDYIAAKFKDRRKAGQH